jgi:hypothetical protein
MSKRPHDVNPPPRGPSVSSSATGAATLPVSKRDFEALAALLGGRESVNRVLKKDSFNQALSQAGELYENREFIQAYERFHPVYEKVVADMQRVLARNAEFEANKVAKEQRKPLAAAKEYVERMKLNAQQVLDQFDRLLRDLKSKPLVRMHLKKAAVPTVAPPPPASAPPADEAATTTLSSANETRLDTTRVAPPEVVSGAHRYRKASYIAPEIGALYSVRDKTGGARIIQIIGKSPDGTLVQVEIIKNGMPSDQPVQLSTESLARQAAKGWCHLLILVAQGGAALTSANPPSAPSPDPNVLMRLDSQNFGRCCADIVRANIKFSTQLIKDVGDGPFRAGNYEQAFLTFEQLAVMFNAAVANSRREIADGRRALTAEKGNLSGKEIQDRTAAFTRSEQLIHTAEREFSTILEGLRMYLRAQQTNLEPAPADHRDRTPPALGG